MLTSRRVLLSLLLSVAVQAHAADPRDLAASIDKRLAAGWTAAKVKPAARSDDAEFLRRVYLDLTGKIPPVGEVRRFLADAAPDKRQILVERLLAGSGYVTHFATVWRHLLAPDADNDPGRQAALAALDNWLRRQFAAEVAYDRMARDLLTLPYDDGTGEKADAPSPRLFYAGREYKPDELAAAAARLFLGVRLECAQCHDHPFAKWKRDQFWSQAAFFADVRRPGPATRTLEIPGSGRKIRARFLDGKALSDGPEDGRVPLAGWLTAPDNPFFARAAVNRLWAHFFGVGLVDPVDDMTEENRPSHPELLDELAQAFVAARHDVKYLIRGIVLSDAYQLSSVARPGGGLQARCCPA